MKRLIASFIVSLILVTNVVAAQEELPTPTLLPDSPLYPVQTFFEQVRLWVTFNNEARTKLRLHYAELRLAEMKEMIKRQKLEYVERLRIRYESEINETENEIKKSEALGRNVTALAEHVATMTYKHVEVLEKLLEKVPEQAKPSIELAINNSVRQHEAFAERIQERIRERSEMAKTINCTTDADCRELICAMVIGNDTPICKDGVCTCGAKWEITNRVEWRERFGEELTAEKQEAIQRIKEATTTSIEKISETTGKYGRVSGKGA